MQRLTYIAARLLFSAACLSAAPAFADSTVVGSWRLLSMTYRNEAAGQEVAPWGAHPIGVITYSADGRMSAVLAAEGRTASGAGVNQAPVDEQARLFRSSFGYAGSYTLESDGVVVHHVEVCTDPTWVGSDQRRFFKIEGNRLIITTAPLRTVSDETARVLTLIWERVE